MKEENAKAILVLIGGAVVVGCALVMELVRFFIKRVLPVLIALWSWNWWFR